MVFYRNKFILSLQRSLLFRLKIRIRSPPSTMVAKRKSYSHSFYILFISPCFSRQYHNYGEIRFNQNKLIMSFIIVNNQLLQNNINILISAQFECKFYRVGRICCENKCMVFIKHYIGIIGRSILLLIFLLTQIY